MKVINRNGTEEEISFDKINNRIQALINKSPPLSNIDSSEITQDVISQIHNGIHTTELDELSGQICASKVTKNPDYEILASRIIISNNHKNTSNNYLEKIHILYTNESISDTLYEYILNNCTLIQSKIDYERDYNFDYFGFKTLEKAYLKKCKITQKLVERVQDMLMRVSLSIHLNDIDKAFETYDLMSNKYFIHASPTLFNAGTNRQQLLSCFLLGIEDSIQGIYKCLGDCALISKWAGGIGLHVSNIRGKGSLIRGTDGYTSGIVPMLKNFNDTACYVNQGGKRLGSFAIYLEPHHPDIMEWLELKKNHGNEDERARDLFYGIWISDLFMNRVKTNADWSLFCPDDCPGLTDAYGAKYEELYIKYESEGKARKIIKAQDVWTQILSSQIETGTPYILYKDSCNTKSNQQNYGTIKSSNLCIEIIEYSDSKEYACCTLASIGLPRFVEPYQTTNELIIYTKTKCNYCKLAKLLCAKNNITYHEINLDDNDSRSIFYTKLNEFASSNTINSVPQIFIKEQDIQEYINFNYDNITIDNYIGDYLTFDRLIKPTFNFNKLIEVTKVITHNLNNVIDLNYYPVPETELSNKKHRPLGIGVQGLADVFSKFNISFDSDEAALLNKQIFAAIYYAAMSKSIELAKEFGAYETFAGSPLSQGIFQFDLWNAEPLNKIADVDLDWSTLKQDVIKYGARNSLLLAPMPTASTSQILGYNECFEPYTSLIYTRNTLAGQFVLINKELIKDLIHLNLWNEEMKDTILIHEGSIKHITEIPEIIRNKYKIVWDLSMKTLINLAADRGIYICQSQSLNLFIAEPNYKNLSSMHFYSWQKGLKSGIYYLRTKPKVSAQKFTIDSNFEKKQLQKKEEEEGCVSCSG